MRVQYMYKVASQRRVTRALCNGNVVKPHVLQSLRASLDDRAQTADLAVAARRGDSWSDSLMTVSYTHLTLPTKA